MLLCPYSFVNGQDNLSLKDFTALNEDADSIMKNYLTALVDRQFSARDSLLASLRSAGVLENK